MWMVVLLGWMSPDVASSIHPERHPVALACVRFYENCRVHVTEAIRSEEPWLPWNGRWRRGLLLSKAANSSLQKAAAAPLIRLGRMKEMKLLPRSDWTFAQEGAGSIIVGAHEHLGYRAFTKFALSDLPNDLISLDDLKRLGIDPREVGDGAQSQD
jgi:hypothetical protein